MRVKSLMLHGVAVLLMAVVAGCAGAKKSVSVPEGAGEKRVSIQASSFRFEPNEIVARSGDRLLIDVENTAGMDHNLTVVDPDGKEVVSRPLPSGRTVSIEVTLDKPGDYPFYCDKPLHPSLGMKGTIRAR